MSVPNLKRIALFVQKLRDGRSRGPSSMSVPNLKWMALFVRKLLGGPKISKLGRDLSHAPFEP